MIYTLLLLLKDVIPSELANHAVVKAVPHAIYRLVMQDDQCIQTSQFYPAGYIHPFEPSHVPPYEAFIYITTRAHDIGYIYLETRQKFANPTYLISCLNAQPEFKDKAIFLAICEGAKPVALMQQFIGDMQQLPQISESMSYIIELYQLAMAARHEVDNLVRIHYQAPITSHLIH